MTYEPTDRSSRETLAVALLTKLVSCGFSLVPQPETCKEAIYSLPVKGTDGKIVVMVYTTVISGPRGPECRGAGEDALRVCAVYKTTSGRERGLIAADHRVNRVGDISDIVHRMYLRMREVYGAAMTGARCTHCGAPKFKSAKGNEVCAELCFLPEAERNRPPTPRPTYRPNPFARRRWGVSR